MSALLPDAPAASTITRDHVVGVLELLATRMLWSSGRPIISGTGLHVSRGWTETVSHARQAVYSESLLKSAYKTLSTAATWHTYVGNKHVSFFDVREQNADARRRILDWAKRRAVQDLQHVIRRRPFAILDAPTRQGELEKLKTAPPRLIAAKLDGDRLYLQFFSTRAYSHREPVDISKLIEQGADYLNDYDELIGVKTRWVPCFDTVVIDMADDLVEFRIDFAPGLNGDKDYSAFARVITEFNRVAAKYIGHEGVGVGLMNLYPAINPLYRDRSCGRVTTLGFVATSKDSSSNNHGQIHRSKSQDFRKDSFHVGGKQHVDKIEPYAIGVTWTARPPKGDLYLEIKGSVKAVYGGKLKSVTQAEVLGCLDGTDYDFVIDQVLQRVPRPKP
jgi:hypothetical protein